MSGPNSQSLVLSCLRINFHGILQFLNFNPSQYGFNLTFRHFDEKTFFHGPFLSLFWLQSSTCKLDTWLTEVGLFELFFYFIFPCFDDVAFLVPLCALVPLFRDLLVFRLLVFVPAVPGLPVAPEPTPMVEEELQTQRTQKGQLSTDSMIIPPILTYFGLKVQT